ncbi:piggyBac transposable element-derived protein 4-like [Penaeus monodon]|uniref:piggyBac transposable element-derived protein 4-like n=1 Tax=Penaeus monodon TaxID=6687 RepID=UPI0018A7320E|nr:piggyBac transposable element-derived protein 4-like [Penaeus monodon]
MKGVDVGDQMASYYPTACCSKVWYRSVFFFLYVMAIVNAWAIHCALGLEESQKAFQVGLTSELMGQFRKGADSTPHRAVPCPSTAAPPRNRMHYVSQIPGKRRRCRVCSRHGRKQSSRNYSADCNVGLCTYGCFEEWHATLSCKMGRKTGAYALIWSPTVSGVYRGPLKRPIAAIFVTWKVGCMALRKHLLQVG